jgi:6-phosphofructokinase 1
MPRLMDEINQRPKEQWWLNLRPIARILAKPGPEAEQPTETNVPLEV